MRYDASEKAELIELVEQSYLLATDPGRHLESLWSGATSKAYLREESPL